MALKGKQKEAFIKLYGDDEEAADQWLEDNVDTRNRAIEKSDLITRSGDGATETEADTETEEQETEIVYELSDEDAAQVLERSETIQQLVTAVETLAERLETNEVASQQRQKQLADQLQEMTDRLETVEADDEAKQREWLENQPRRFSGKTKHIIRPRVERSNDNSEENETSAVVVAETMAAKRIPVY